jgi:hypothetical protein
MSQGSLLLSAQSSIGGSPYFNEVARGESWVARIYCAPTLEEAWVDFSKALAVCRSRLTMPFLN